MPELTRTSKYFVATEYDMGLTIPSETSDGWASVMNANWTAIDSKLKSVSDTVLANLASAQLLEQGLSTINYCINPDLNVWQRDVTGLVTDVNASDSADAGSFRSDQWKFYKTAAPSTTVTRGQRWLGVSHAGSNSAIMTQRIERFRSFRGKTVTFALSVYTPNSETVTIYVEDGVSARSSASGSSTTQFTQILVAHAVSSTATRLQLRIKVTATGIGTSYIRAGVLAIGDFTETGVKYYRNAPGQDLLDCQRYYERISLGSGASFVFSASSSTDKIRFPVKIVPKYAGGSVSHTVDTEDVGAIASTLGGKDNTVNFNVDVDSGSTLTLSNIVVEADLW